MVQAMWWASFVGDMMHSAEGVPWAVELTSC